MAVTLIVSTSGSAPQSITLDQPRVVVGRGAHVDVRLPSREVSARYPTPAQQFTIRDLGGWPEVQRTLFAPGAAYDRAVAAAGNHDPQ